MISQELSLALKMLYRFLHRESHKQLKLQNQFHNYLQVEQAQLWKEEQLLPQFLGHQILLR